MCRKRSATSGRGTDEARSSSPCNGRPIFPALRSCLHKPTDEATDIARSFEELFLFSPVPSPFPFSPSGGTANWREAFTHNTCIRTRRHSRALQATQRHSIRPAQAADQGFRLALTGRRSVVRNNQRPRGGPGLVGDRADVDVSVVQVG